MRLGNNDEFSQLEHIELGWTVYTVFREYLKAFLQVPGSLKKIAQEVNKFDISRLVTTYTNWS